MSKSPDVVVIGAGAAGLSAARRLRKDGLDVLIVDAAGRVGGRAWTDQHSLGVPVDLGCSWVSGSNKNSLVKIGREAGLTLIDHTDAPDALWVEGQPAGDADWAAYDRAWTAIEKALNKAGKKGFDGPASDVIPQDLPYSATVQSWIGPMDHGADFRDLAPFDYWDQAEDQPSYLVREGFGTLVAHLAKDLPIALNTAVTGVDWSGDGACIETSAGTIEARACIVTVSTGVLASGRLAFTPELPLATQEAIHGVPMGLLVKVPLLFDGARFGIEEGCWMTYKLPEETPARACFFVAWPCGYDYVFGNIGGSLGWELSRAGENATVDFALDELAKLLGSDIRKHFVKGLMTDWALNPLTCGAYSVQRPGCAGARKALGAPIGDRIFFAGEALGGERAALANGAYDSGRKVGKSVAKMLRRSAA